MEVGSLPVTGLPPSVLPEGSSVTACGMNEAQWEAVVRTGALSRDLPLSPPALSALAVLRLHLGQMEQCFLKLVSSQCSLLDSEMTATIHFGLEKVSLEWC